MGWRGKGERLYEEFKTITVDNGRNWQELERSLLGSSGLNSTTHIHTALGSGERMKMPTK